MIQKWHKRFLDLAQLVASWSKDCSTKVGAVIVDDKNRIVSIGYNGFARGVNDSEERYKDRDTKIKMVVHAESNAILFAQRPLEDCTLFTWPFAPCSNCAANVIQSGIKKVIAPPMTPEIAARWAESVKLSMEQFKEAGVEFLEIHCG